MPNLSSLLSPLYRLLKARTPWSWTDEQQIVFDKSKELLQSSPLLVHFDPSKELLVSAYASPVGIGGVLSHIMPDGSEHPIAYTSRSLSVAERKYSQLEKEGLAIVFAVSKFHQFLHGRQFSIYSVHQPLKHLFNETRQVPVVASANIQRWALTLSTYQYKIQYRPGTQMENADALSRLPLPDLPDTVPVPGDHTVLIHHLKEAITTAANIKTWTDKDPHLSRIRHFTQNGWNVYVPTHHLPLILIDSVNSVF